MPCSSTDNPSSCASNGLKKILESGGDPFLTREFIALCDFAQKKAVGGSVVEN
jgi:hypothetical protein